MACTARVSSIRRIIAGAAALLWAAAASAAALAADAPALAEGDQACLACHGEAGLTKTFGRGESVSLQVKGEVFARSVHAPIGCSGCHSEVDPKNHPGGGRPFDTARAFSLAQAEGCRQCHEEAFEQQKGSVHAARIEQGNPLAPTCTGCHGVHDVTPKTAYETCISCHASALAAHRQWLPNAASHHETVSCAACHAPKALRMVDLRFFDVAAKRWLVQSEGAQSFDKLAASLDKDRNGFDPAELAALLKTINGDPAAPKTLRGRIELRNNVEAHRLADKTMAIRACDGCHRAGAEPFQNVTVSMTGRDGRPVRHAAQRRILDSPLSVASLPEFYAIGGTRSPVLDWLFLAALAAGLGFPLGHLALRWIFRRMRKERK